MNFANIIFQNLTFSKLSSFIIGYETQASLKRWRVKEKTASAGGASYVPFTYQILQIQYAFRQLRFALSEENSRVIPWYLRALSVIVPGSIAYLHHNSTDRSPYRKTLRVLHQNMGTAAHVMNFGCAYLIWRRTGKRAMAVGTLAALTVSLLDRYRVLPQATRKTLNLVEEPFIFIGRLFFSPGITPKLSALRSLIGKISGVFHKKISDFIAPELQVKSFEELVGEEISLEEVMDAKGRLSHEYQAPQYDHITMAKSLIVNTQKLEEFAKAGELRDQEHKGKSSTLLPTAEEMRSLNRHLKDHSTIDPEFHPNPDIQFLAMQSKRWEDSKEKIQYDEHLDKNYVANRNALNTELLPSLPTAELDELLSLAEEIDWRKHKVTLQAMLDDDQRYRRLVDRRDVSAERLLELICHCKSRINSLSQNAENDLKAILEHNVQWRQLPQLVGMPVLIKFIRFACETYDWNSVDSTYILDLFLDSRCALKEEDEQEHPKLWAKEQKRIQETKTWKLIADCIDRSSNANKLQPLIERCRFRINWDANIEAQLQEILNSQNKWSFILEDIPLKQVAELMKTQCKKEAPNQNSLTELLGTHTHLDPSIETDKPELWAQDQARIDLAYQWKKIADAIPEDPKTRKERVLRLIQRGERKTLDFLIWLAGSVRWHYLQRLLEEYKVTGKADQDAERYMKRGLRIIINRLKHRRILEGEPQNYDELVRMCEQLSYQAIHAEDERDKVSIIACLGIQCGEYCGAGIFENVENLISQYDPPCARGRALKIMEGERRQLFDTVYYSLLGSARELAEKNSPLQDIKEIFKLIAKAAFNLVINRSWESEFTQLLVKHSKKIGRAALVQVPELEPKFFNPDLSFLRKHYSLFLKTLLSLIPGLSSFIKTVARVKDFKELHLYNQAVHYFGKLAGVRRLGANNDELANQSIWGRFLFQLLAVKGLGALGLPPEGVVLNGKYSASHILEVLRKEMGGRRLNDELLMEWMEDWVFRQIQAGKELPPMPELAEDDYHYDCICEFIEKYREAKNQPGLSDLEQSALNQVASPAEAIEAKADRCKKYRKRLDKMAVERFQALLKLAESDARIRAKQLTKWYQTDPNTAIIRAATGNKRKPNERFLIAFALDVGLIKTVTDKDTGILGAVEKQIKEEEKANQDLLLQQMNQRQLSREPLNRRLLLTQTKEKYTANAASSSTD